MARWRDPEPLAVTEDAKEGINNRAGARGAGSIFLFLFSVDQVIRLAEAVRSFLGCLPLPPRAHRRGRRPRQAKALRSGAPSTSRPTTPRARRDGDRRGLYVRSGRDTRRDS